MIVGNEHCTRAFEGYAVNRATTASNSDFLGWVYPTFQANACPLGVYNVPPSTMALDKDSDGLPDGVEVALGLNEESANGDCEGANDALEYGFANLPSDPMTLTSNCVDGRVRVLRANPNATGEARVIFSNPAGPMAFPAGTAVRVTFFQGGGWPTVVPPGCVYDDSEVGSSFEHYLCSIGSALPPSPGSVIEFVFQVEARTNPSPPPHQAVVRIPAGFTDPGLPTNNVALF